MSVWAHAGLGAIIAGAILAFEPRARRSALVIALAGAALALTGFFAARPVNPAALQAVLDLEMRCAGESSVARTTRCEQALRIQRHCHLDGCPFAAYHEQLEAVGFQLPPVKR